MNFEGITFQQQMRVLNGRVEWRWVSGNGKVISPIFRSGEAAHNWARSCGIVFHGYNDPIPATTTLRKLSPIERVVPTYYAQNSQSVQLAKRKRKRNSA